jgi:alkylation response protein AidB-like acyl-CoA dehydrogenase
VAELKDTSGGGSGQADLGDFREKVRATLLPLQSEFDSWERDGHIPRSYFEHLGKQGIFRERWQYGAAGGHPLARVLIEELTSLNGGVALATSIHSEVFIHGLSRFAGPSMHGVLEDALDGRAVGCFAATEPTAGSDLTAIQACAAKEAGGWRLRAEKRFTTNAGSATHVIVLANAVDGRRGACLYCLPMDRPGVELLGFYDTLGVRSADTCALSIDAAIGPEDIIGKPGFGLGVAFQLLDFERLAAAAGLIAGAETALRIARAWARRRTQFSAPLIRHQALAHRLADRWTDLFAARAALSATCDRLGDGSIPHVEIAATKLLAARAASAAVDEALQILGARGYTTVFPVERMYRDVRLTRIGGGSDEVMRNIVSAFLDTSDPEAETWISDCEKTDF